MASEEWFEKAKVLIGQAQEEIVNLSRLGKVQLNVSFLERERDQILLSLGELTYEMVKEGMLKSSKLDRLVGQAQRVEEKIEGLKSEKKEIASRLLLKS